MLLLFFWKSEVPGIQLSYLSLYNSELHSEIPNLVQIKSLVNAACPLTFFFLVPKSVSIKNMNINVYVSMCVFFE